VDGRSTGAPMEACGTKTDIVPSHPPTAPSHNPFPYSIDLIDFENIRYCYSTGQTYKSK